MTKTQLKNKIAVDLQAYQRKRRLRKAQMGELGSNNKPYKPMQVTFTDTERKAVASYVALGQRGAEGAKLSALLGASAIILHFIVSGENKDEALLALRSIAPRETAGDATRAMAANLQELAKCV